MKTATGIAADAYHDIAKDFDHAAKIIERALDELGDTDPAISIALRHSLTIAVSNAIAAKTADHEYRMC